MTTYEVKCKCGKVFSMSHNKFWCTTPECENFYGNVLTVKEVNENNLITIPNLKIVNDMIHNIEELAELQKELTKFLRGNLRIEKMIEEIQDVEIAISNIKKWFNLNDLTKAGKKINE